VVAASGARLEIFFDRRKGTRLVYGWGALALAFILIGLVVGDGALMLASLPFIAGAGFHLPMRQAGPQVIFDDTGIRLEGLGFLPWSEIADFDLSPGWERTPREAELLIRTYDPLELALEIDLSTPPARTFQIMCWGFVEADLLKIKLTNLAWSEPDKLMRTARSFWREAL